MHWRTEILAAAAGVLQREHPGLSNFDVATVVWSVAAREPAEIGGLRLINRARSRLIALNQQRSQPLGRSGGGAGMKF